MRAHGTSSLNVRLHAEEHRSARWVSPLPKALRCVSKHEGAHGTVLILRDACTHDRGSATPFARTLLQDEDGERVTKTAHPTFIQSVRIACPAQSVCSTPPCGEGLRT